MATGTAERSDAGSGASIATSACPALSAAGDLKHKFFAYGGGRFCSGWRSTSTENQRP
ncbi:MAG: hypothetical protein IPL71_02450 [Anaerolineales bacterium]|uniref:hypothetical protein n=1 Tax=Candidatus Villigracilis proximus TaxID=3140683 RepID=UPI00313746B8|nr:hypothetical protein [Anaerolineales bacterium]